MKGISPKNSKNIAFAFAGLALTLVVAAVGIPTSGPGRLSSSPGGLPGPDRPAVLAASAAELRLHIAEPSLDAAAGPAAVGRSAARLSRSSNRANAQDPRSGSHLSLNGYGVRRHLTARQIGRMMLHDRFHWRRWQFKYLNRLWTHESGWNRFASNPYSGAYGIPQALPGAKLASAGRDWRWSAKTQILWGMRYIRARYRTPYWAWRHECGYNWY